MTNFVQLYKSTDANAPTLTGQANSLCSLLNAVLINGYSTAVVGNITRLGAVATATLAAPNTTLVTGNYVTIAGCDQAEYNITAQITMLSTTQFTYAVTGTPVTPATTSGSITYKKAGLGWSSPFTGVNTAVYRSNNITSPQHYLQVKDNGSSAGGTLEASVRGFESMLDADYGIFGFPTVTQQAGGLCWRKSASTDGTIRAWTIVGDDKTFWVLMNTGGTTATTEMYGFGWFPSYVAGDMHNTFIVGLTQFNSGSVATGLANGSNDSSPSQIGLPTQGWAVARNFSGIGGAHVPGFSAWATNFLGSTAILAFPNPGDGGYYAVQPVLAEQVGTQMVIRGRVPGFYAGLHSTALTHYDQVTDVVGLSGITLTSLSIRVSSGSNGQVLVDTFGPWT